MLRLVFTNWNAELSEERDFPDDPAPYLVLALKAISDRCTCRRPIPLALFRAAFEREEALALANAILAHYRVEDGRRADRERMRAAVAREIDRLETLEEFERRLSLGPDGEM